MRILVVEDDKKIGSFVVHGLKHLLQRRQHAGRNEVGGSFMLHPLH